jgi:hypothetical protein
MSQRLQVLRLVLLTVAIGAAGACGGNGGAGGGGGGATATAADTAAADTATGAEAAPTAEPGTLELTTQNKSGQRGTATLAPREGGDGFTVVLEVTPPKRFAGPTQHAHIHDVTCEEYASISGFDAQLATVEDTLNDLQEGRSETTFLATPLSERTTGAFSINVHEQNHPFVAVAGGDNPRAE